MADSGDIDSALTAKLLADATLMALATDGIYFDEASSGLTRFVIISLVTEFDEPMFLGRAYEDATYMVKYVERGLSSVNAKAAAARIDALLDGGTLTITGYGLMLMRRESRIRYLEVDDVDASIRWQHRGGNYRVMAAS
jgi:hypothetical protein